MNVERRWAFLAALGLGCVVGTAAAQGSRVDLTQKPLCGPSGHKTITSNRYARVYSGLSTARGVPFEARLCQRTSNSVPLGSVLSARTLVLRGRRVAYAELTPDPFGAAQQTGVISGRLSAAFRPLFGNPGRIESSPTVDRSPFPSQRTAVTRIRLTRRGSVAWSACRMAFDDYTRCGLGVLVRVFAAAPSAFAPVGVPEIGRNVVLLGQSTRIDPDSLRISPSERRFAWTDAGITRSAPAPQ